MIKAFIARFRKPFVAFRNSSPEPVPDFVEIAIKCRAIRTCNRKPDLVATNVGKHSVLALKLGKPYMPVGGPWK